MDIGIPKELRTHEHRVALTPGGVKALTERGHRVYVETAAGGEAGHNDDDYRSAGATVVYARDEVFARPELLLGVAPPAPDEFKYLQPGQTVLAFWALPAAHAEDLRALMAREVTAIGLEVVQDEDGHAPALAAMSEIAGSLSVVIGAGLLLNEFGGKGILLNGSPGVPPANLVILGTGTLGRAAARTAVGIGAEVLMLDNDIAQLRRALMHMPHPVPTMISTPQNLERALVFADLVIASPAQRGERAPLLITRALLRKMKPRSVLMDLAIDMGGCCETSRPTSFPNPTYEAEGITHFCVPNLSTTVARSATKALTNTVLPWVLDLVAEGTDVALARHAMLRRGTYLHHGRCAMPSLCESFGLDVQPVGEA